MKRFHARRKDKEIDSLEELWDVLRSQKYMTVACSKDNQPYLFTVNYAFDHSKNSLYFHCAPEGKKMEYLASNPLVWGQVIEDRGYLYGKCDHNYRSVHFQGVVQVVQEEKEKMEALHLLIDQQELDPEPVKRNLTPKQIENTAIVKILIIGISGKKYTG